MSADEKKERSEESNEPAGAKDAPEKPAAPAMDVAEERHKLVAMAAALPMCLLALVPTMPFGANESLLFEQLKRDRGSRVLLVFFMIWPIFVGAGAISRGLSGKVPGLGLFLPPAIMFTLLSFATTGVMVYGIFASSSSVLREPPIVGMFVFAASSLYVLAKGFFRKGWRRFNHLLAGMYLLWLATLMLVLIDGAGLFNPPVLGEWVALFATTALLPLFAFAFFPRRA